MRACVCVCPSNLGRENNKVEDNKTHVAGLRRCWGRLERGKRRALEVGKSHLECVGRERGLIVVFCVARHTKSWGSCNFPNLCVFEAWHRYWNLLGFQVPTNPARTSSCCWNCSCNYEFPKAVNLMFLGFSLHLMFQCFMPYPTQAPPLSSFANLFPARSS